MVFPDGIKIYGDVNYRDKKCPLEGAEQGTFFNMLREEFEHSYALTAHHVKNEGRRTMAQIQKEKAQGMTGGAADINIPGGPSFVCELKRKDHTESKMQPKQGAYLIQAHKSGAFVCIALGWEAAWEAFNDWRAIVE